MLTIIRSKVFQSWLTGLRDRRAKARIADRLERLAKGNAGDAKPVGEGVSELRIDYGPGYRVYYQQRDKTIIVLLYGGDKRSQEKDIKAAKKLAKEWTCDHEHKEKEEEQGE